MGKLVQCKTCKHQVDQFAQACPNCGVKYPGASTTKVCLLMTGLIFIMSFSIALCSRKTTPSLAEGTARHYLVVMEQDLSVSGRIRHRWFIISDDAKTFADKAATVIQAVKDLKSLRFANDASVVLRTAKGEPLAEADYVDNHVNPWVVQSTDDDGLLKRVDTPIQ